MLRFTCCVAFLAMLVFPVFAQFSFQYNPSTPGFMTVPGHFDTRNLQIINSGTEDAVYSLLAMPPALLSLQKAYYSFDQDCEDLISGGEGNFIEPRWVADRQGRPDKAARFLGGSNSFETPDYGLTNNFSLSFWAKPTTNQPMSPEGFYGFAVYTNYLLWPDWYEGSHAGLGIALGQNGIMVIEHAAGYMPVLLSYSADLSGWNHYVINLESQVPKLYINGSLVRTGNPSQRLFTHLSHIYGGAAYGYFRGMLDDLCLYSTPLTDAQAQIESLYSDQSNLFIENRKGELGPGQQILVPVHMIDTSLDLGLHSLNLSLCQQGSSPQFATIPVQVNVTNLNVPQSPETVWIEHLENGNVQVMWTPASQDIYGNPITPSGYRIFAGNVPSRLDQLSLLGTTSITTFIHTSPGSKNWFYYVVSYLE